MAGLPNIAGVASGGASAWSGEGLSASGFAYLGSRQWVTGPGSGGDFYDVNFDASRSSAIYGSSTTVTPLSLSAILIIKY